MKTQHLAIPAVLLTLFAIAYTVYLLRPADPVTSPIDLVAAHTGSMEPLITGGDIITVAPVDWSDLRVGHIVVVHHPRKDDTLLAHRITAIDAHQATLKGDAAPRDDSFAIWPKDVLGLVTHINNNPINY